MWMTDYVNEIQKKLVIQYGFPPDARSLPQNVPDGEYPMEINGKLESIRIKNGRIYRRNFDPLENT